MAAACVVQAADRGRKLLAELVGALSGPAVQLQVHHEPAEESAGSAHRSLAAANILANSTAGCANSTSREVDAVLALVAGADAACTGSVRAGRLRIQNDGPALSVDTLDYHVRVRGNPQAAIAVSVDRMEQDWGRNLPRRA